ncbi:N-acetylglucosamine-6-phosphate deacetylase [Flavobacterium hydatis]|uniref:N-acetylglucosamine-6-phosphate deacetylase n=1 Tax=Flavobacterium hydatis TaxID=991 RepID=A0A085ZC95_FLAHY|nr:N-acetylglucosamine-6-phosphate deacetylase [Flavobacterium hydatis]KFF02059.1 N-acetylglucosamine-6-phosphate deacetylase [Flavobacterium hydatis]OXA92434.1 N-acetylglucosamine-6-phosphate deacetylase [Flavobacterium hydatis]
MKQAIINTTIHTGEEIINNGVIIIENGTILSVQKEIPNDIETIDLQGNYISAGFIDIQINGGEKLYFSQTPTEETIQDIYESSLKYGTTHILPCLISSSHETILKGIEAVRSYREKHDNGVIGMHLEGPFLNPLKRGAHSIDHVRKPTNTELEEIIRLGKNVIKVITIAPECFTDEQLNMLLESGITISIGHSTVTHKEAQVYFSKGIKLVTHLFNAMTQFGHREPGLVGATFENENVYAPVILDGAHCDYAAAKLAYKLKQDKFFLISDATFLGRKVSSFVWDNFNAHLEDGFYRNEEGSLAGASISMLDAVQNAYNHLDVSADEAIRMATSHVANAIGMGDKIGKIKAGFPASFVQFNADLSIIETLSFDTVTV